MTGHDDFRARGGSPDSATVLAELEKNVDTRCPACGTPLCGHDVVLSLVCGYKAAPRCLSCAAGDMGLAAADLAERAWIYVRGRECFLAGWTAASRREEVAAEGIPSCFEVRLREIDEDPHEHGHSSERRERFAAGELFPDETWDAGELACGELLLELRRRLRTGPAGRTFALRALDSSAPEDIPAWCGLTGHTLLRAEHPRYWIRAKA